jgi:threonine dehydratase
VIGLEDIQAAAERIEGVAHKTPVLTSRTLNEQTSANIFLKAENFQRTGTFKFRGAFNKISSLSTDELRSGIATYSSGNHAQAVALAARLMNTKAMILMPEDAPASKREAAEGYGAQVVTYDRYREDRVKLGEELAREKGMTLVPPYEDPLIMAGQGTVALELISETESIDLLLTPVGGGGLIAGCSTAAKAVLPKVQVVGVEPAEGNDTKLSLDAGTRVEIKVPRTIADGLQASIPGEMTFETNRKNVDEIVLVTDEEILAAMEFLFARMKIVVEPSGAAAAAAVLFGRVSTRGRAIGVVISGGNIGWRRFSELVGA